MKKVTKCFVEKIRKAAEKGAGRASIKGMHEPKVPMVLVRLAKQKMNT